MAQSCVCLVHQRNAEPGAKSGASPTEPYRQTHIIRLLYKSTFDVKVISGNRTKLSLTLLVSCIASALYTWRHKGTCIHVHVPYASCKECSLHSHSFSLPLSLSLHQQHSHCRSFYLYYILTYSIKTLPLRSPHSALLLLSYHAIFALSNFLTCSLLQLLIVYVAVVIITQGRKHFKLRFQMTKGQQILAQMTIQREK